MLLEARNLSKSFAARDGKGRVHAVNGVDLSVEAGTTLGIVGESGCGKSTLARLLLRLIEPSGGTLHFDGGDVLAMNATEMKALRRTLQFVHQDPFASLNPRMSVQSIISEPLEIHAIGTSTSRRQRVADLLSLVGLDQGAATKYPHEFSGGQRQRICIARAIAIEPKLVVLDEPVSALDVSIQAQILNLLNDLKTRLGLTYVLISHDLSVIKYLCDQVAVMYLGKFVEQGSAEAVLNKPLHPYTQALVSAVPEISSHAQHQRIILAGEPPNPEQLPTGCAFHPRCFKAVESCKTVSQQLRALSTQNIACDQANV